ncbi:MAG: BamA/TamA family outer membrane protein [Bacteroidales bacterium]|nr:BamA/TamA family outer membrane protein [Bacteroidales bacterium]
MKSYFKYILVFMPVALLFVGCNPTHKLPANQFLLTRMKVETDKKSDIRISDMEELVLQQSNKKFIGLFHTNLWVRNITMKWKPTKFRSWIQKVSGPQPSIFDINQAEGSVRSLKNYLNNNGYFNATVSYDVKYHTQKAHIHYSVVLGNPYTLRNFSIVSEDSFISDYARNIMKETQIMKDKVYKFTLLESERNRLTRELRNSGFFQFSNDFLTYEIDSALNSHQMDIELKLNRPVVTDSRGVNISQNHKRWFINQVYVLPQYLSMRLSNEGADTLHHEFCSKIDTNDCKNLNFVVYQTPRIKFRVLANSIHVRPDQAFNLTEAEQTTRSLSELPLYKYVNVDYVPRYDLKGDSVTAFADCVIKLGKADVQAFSVESEATNSGGDLGISGQLVWENKNLFRGAEVFRLKLRGAMEMQQSFGNNVSNKFLIFNTIETGVEASLTFPRFLGPIRPDRFPKYLRPKTTFTTGFNYQARPDYKRYLTNMSYGYQWSESAFSTHILNPIEINAVRIFPTESFLELLDQLNSERLKAQFTNHLITALKYSYIYSDQERGKVRNYRFMRFNAESAGNLLYLIDNVINVPKNEDGNFTFFNIRYAQYLKTSIDLRYFKMLTADNLLGFRLFAGAGKPYGNSQVLPFEKGFFAGGANGMRGWQLKSLGPGEFYDPLKTAYDRMGDIQLEFNTEYRFPIYNFVKGAFFADAGNIWLMDNNLLYPGGKFDFSKFYKEIALDAGFGIRFDFSFFAFRLDAAMPLYDPAKPLGSRFRFSKLQLADVVWNFGIGYPF